MPSQRKVKSAMEIRIFLDEETEQWPRSLITLLGLRHVFRKSRSHGKTLIFASCINCRCFHFMEFQDIWFFLLACLIYKRKICINRINRSYDCLWCYYNRKRRRTLMYAQNLFIIKHVCTDESWHISDGIYMHASIRVLLKDEFIKNSSFWRRAFKGIIIQRNK